MSYLASTVVVGLGVQHLSNSGNGSAAVGSLIRSSNAEHGDVAPDASGGGDSAEGGGADGGAVVIGDDEGGGETGSRCRGKRAGS